MPELVRSRIVDAYVHGLQMRRQQEQQDVDNERKKEEGARAEKQLQGYLKHLDAESEHQKAQIALQQQNLELNKKSHVFEATKFLADQQNRGNYDPNGQVPDQASVGGQIQTTQTPGGMGPTYDIGNLPTTQQNVQPTLSTMPSPQPAPVELAPGITMNPAGIRNNDQIFQQHLAQLKAAAPIEAASAGQKAGAVAKATSQAELPAQKELLEIKTQAQKDIDAANNTRAIEVVNKNASSRAAAASIQAAASRYAADKRNAVNPEMITNNAILHATGQGGTALGNNKDDVATKLVMNKLGYADFSSKDAQALKEIHGMDPLYSKMVEVINLLPDDKLNAAGQRVLSKIPGGDLANLKAQIISASGAIARTRGSEKGVLTDRDIGRQIDALVKPGMTKAQALDNLKFLQQYTNSKVSDQILGGMSDKQKLLILHQYDFDPRSFDDGIQYKGQRYAKYSQNPNNPEEWGVFNTKTGQYDSLGK